ncbi:PDCD5-related protein [Pavlovales sp. CCMP2436]|nr:PDCD5-related protein [Pavlovales sp. CCMP2436]
MLGQILSSEARVRLTRIAIVKPDKARQVEDAVMNMARTGQIRSQLDEAQLIQILEQVTGPAEDSRPKITVARRRVMDDDDAGLFDDDV